MGFLYSSKFSSCFKGSFLSLLVISGLILSGGAVFAAEGANPGGDSNSDITACNSSNNAKETLCGEGGSKGGGASWRLYKADSDNVQIEAYVRGNGSKLTEKAFIKGCKTARWYLRYGYERLKYNNNKKFGEQIGVLSITGNTSPKNKWISNKMALIAGGDQRIFNDYGAIPLKRNSSGEIDIKSFKETAEKIGADGVKMKWEDVKSMFDKMKDYDKKNGGKYNTANFSMDKGEKRTPGLGYFCFTPQSLLSEGEFGSKSSVTVPGKLVRQHTALNQAKVEKKITLKKGESVTLDFEHYLFAKFDPKSVKNDFSNYLEIKDMSHGESNAISESHFKKSDSWQSGDGSDTKGMFKLAFRHNTKYSIKVDYKEGGGAETYCQSIGNFPKKIQLPDGTIDSSNRHGADRSSICVRIEMADTSPTVSGICFRDGIIDATKDQGNNAIWSYVRNASRNSVEFPALSNPRNDNSSLNSDLRETEVVGGNHGVSDSRVFIFARPHDGIQFRHVFCFGAQAVESLPFDKAKSNPGSSRYHNTPSSTFNIATGPDNRFLYGDSITSNQISFKSREHSNDIDITGASNPVSETSEWGRAYDDKSGEPYKVEPSDTGNSISQTTSIDKNSKAWIGGSAERTFEWKKFRRDRRTEFVDRNFLFGQPTGCGCNIGDKDFIINQPRSYPDTSGMDLNLGLEFKQCEISGECTKDCLPLLPQPGAPLPPPGAKPEYPDDCDRDGKCKFDEYSEDSSKSFRFFPLNTLDDNGRLRATTEVKVPYNFDTRLESAPRFEGAGTVNGSGIVFAGELVNGIEADIKIVPRINRVVADDNEYATNTPEIQIKTIAFTINSGTTKDTSGIDNITKTVPGESLDARSVLMDINYNKILDIDSGKQAFNSSAKEDGSEEKINLSSLVVPDEEVGTKLCVMTAIYPADSHGFPDRDIPDNNNQDAAMKGTIMKDKHWRLSPVACRTIAKKPSLQSWNGGIIADGNISGAPAHKYSSAIGNIDILPESRAGDEITHFGSWSEYELIGAGSGQISGFGSGASMGYGFNLMATYNLPAGKKLGKNESLICNISQLTIANADYRNSACNPDQIGSSGISIDDTIRERLEGRYRNLVNGAAKVTEINSDYNCSYDGNTYQSSLAGFACANNGVKYIKGDNINIDNSSGLIMIGAYSGSEIKAKERNNNTMVIDASEKVYINSNIKYRTTDAAAYGYFSISSLPQVLIFAKNIYISSSVTNVDAWLIAENIYTCAEAHDGDSIKDSISAAISDDVASGESACGKQLRINGPVFVGSQTKRGKLHLLRHAGAYPGNEATGANRGNFTNPVLNADGSVTPAEIFNLRLDAYLWAYSQAERLTQAFVTYSRELPPRY